MKFELKHLVKSLEEIRARRKPVVNINEKHKDGLTLNDKIAIFLTSKVGSMWCAYAFTILALISLPVALSLGVGAIIAWTAQTFIQLVLLPVIMVGQNVQSAHSELRAEQDFQINKKAEEEIETILQHLENQNELMLKILEGMGK